MSYAVVWSERGEPEVPGRLDLGDGCLVLSGRRAGGGESQRRVPLAELVDVHLDRGRGGGRVLVLVEVDGTRFELTSLEGMGTLHELADELSAGQGKASAPAAAA